MYLLRKSKKRQDLDVITVTLRDPDGQMKGLLEYIRDLANPGHSFEVVVDPDSRSSRKSFFMDGDGALFVKDIK